MKGLIENYSKKNLFILFVLLFTLVSMLNVSALIIGPATRGEQILIGVYNVSDVANNTPNSLFSHAYGNKTGLAWNYTNLSTNRPYLTLNISLFNATSVNVTLTVYPVGGDINRYHFVPGALNGYPNVTVVRNDTISTIYFNNTWPDGLYNWRLNASNWSLQSVGAEIQNMSNSTDLYALVIDTNAPGGRIYTLPNASNSQSATAIWYNLTSDENASSLGSAFSVGGGFVSFYLRNQSGVINWSIRPRNVFDTNTNATNNFTFFMSGGSSNLVDGTYFFNASANDSVGNTRWFPEVNITIDSVSPVVAITSSEGTTIQRLQSTIITCQATDMHPANITLTISGETGTFCSNQQGASSCTGTYTSNTATTRTATCTVYDMTARTTSTTLDIVIEQETTNGPPISQPGTGGGRRSSTIGDIVANQPFTMQIPANIAASLGVESITVLSTVNAPNAKLEVNGLSDAPSGVSIPGNVYKYLEIRKTNLADSALKEAVVVSLVKKEWIQQNNVNPSNIVLFRLKDGVWERYTPSNVQEKDGTYRFEAKVPGFSTFAIGVDKQASQTTTDATTDDGTSTSDNTNIPTTDKNVEKTSLMPVLVIILVLIVIGAVVWYLVGRKKK